ncbi:MAG: tetratricopeptide repeat protein [Tannerellaceae bacterium]|jgi:tetratricopeptide (TPR) repeat protein|nr:tetratricopeptide repeat protein [Tannerellaceae bacterium]
MKQIATLLILLFFSASLCTCTHPRGEVEDTALCFALLEKERSELSGQLSSVSGAERAAALKKMLDRGMWEQARPLITEGNTLSDNEQAILLAYYHLLNNKYREADREIEAVLQTSPDNPEAQKIKIQLLIEAWKLDEALQAASDLAQVHPQDLDIPLLQGRALLLERKYDEASDLVARLHRQFPENGRVYLLEADIHFWNRHPEKAEPLLVKSLQLEPFNADARFSYGYAIWRRVDATQLNQMAAQWELALALNPLHFQTHWHWGNGHTNRTFVDYADPQEDEIRRSLEAADSLFTANQTDRAIALTYLAEETYPQSVLPLMHRASLWYGDFDHPRRALRLDSAALLFREILKRKPHYGPAHNGLAAVIKSQRIPYLSTYDSITAVLRHTEISDPAHFEKVFPDVGYYPGVWAKAMAWNQLYTAIVYFPFLTKQDEVFVIPPLHKDLAIVMKSPYFRYATTFDNRQWMDIRGVGSGAAAIEYVERGAYGERNVILHEYVHLFHESVLTDYQNRRIRALYYSAMENDRTLDYYSQNNEHEYLAQTYPAYFEPVKVHPLDFKSMNTTSALLAKDPDMYHFLDSLIKNEQSYLDGNKQALASNWAQVYIHLSRKQTDSPALAAALLDTALLYDPHYQPALLAYARLQLHRDKPAEALSLIQTSEQIDPAYAPTYQAYADWVKKTETNPAAALQQQAEWLKKALDLEQDYQTRAGMAQALRRLYADHAKIKEAVAEMQTYVKEGPEVSTYLRDRKDDARMYIASQKALLGDKEALGAMDALTKQKPQNYSYAIDYADALAAHGQYPQAIALIEKAQRIFQSNRNRRADFDLRIAEYYQASGQTDSAQVYYRHCQEAAKALTPADTQRLYRLSLRLDAKQDVPAADPPAYPAHSIDYIASCYYTLALKAETAGDAQTAIDHYEQALALHPYLVQVYDALVKLHTDRQDTGAAKKIKERLKAITL